MNWVRCSSETASVSTTMRRWISLATSQSRKHRGYRSQKVFADYVRPVFPHAEPTGAGRQGRDILSTPGVWFELKARSGFNPLEALKQMERESEGDDIQARSEEHTSELQSQSNLVCRLLLEKKK